MKFKYKQKVKVIGDSFYAGQTGVVHHNIIQVSLWPWKKNKPKYYVQFDGDEGRAYYIKEKYLEPDRSYANLPCAWLTYKDIRNKAVANLEKVCDGRPSMKRDEFRFPRTYSPLDWLEAQGTVSDIRVCTEDGCTTFSNSKTGAIYVARVTEEKPKKSKKK